MHSNSSPKQARSKDKQDKLDLKATKVITECGGRNFIQAEYFQQLSRAVVGNELAALETMQPNIKITNSKAWIQAICLVNAFLKRHKMDLTLKTVKTEFTDNPKSTGYKTASMVDSTFHNLLKLSQDIADITFEERIREFTDELALTPNTSNI